MYQTTEVRWFQQGDIPEQILGIYGISREEIRASPARKDQYLSLNNPDIGIKKRGTENIEIKHCTRHHGAIQFQKNTSGNADDWIKWSFNTRENKFGPIEDNHTGWWISIHKQRMLKTLFYTSKGDIIKTCNKNALDGKCEWELSRLWIEDARDTWWSMAFELTGHEVNRENMLKNVVNHALSKGPIKLQINDSFSYPGWMIKQLH